jgi:hypothetical protein
VTLDGHVPHMRAWFVRQPDLERRENLRRPEWISWVH